MSVSTIRAISILLLLASYTIADLPSCARAKCVHCAVDFIDRMCPTACAGCKGQHQSVLPVTNVQRPPQPPPAFNNQPQFAQSVNTRQISNEGGPQIQRPQQQQQQFQPQVQTQQPQQQHQQQQQPLLNIPLQPHAQPVQFAAPVYQGNQIPYPQNQVQTATLAPLVEPPKVASFDPMLSRQPADLAQPLPEYQNGQIAYPQQPAQQAPQFTQQQQGFGLPQAQQQGYGQQVDNIFNQPNPFQLPQAPQQQNLFGATATSGAQAQQPAAFNPFQPFLQQTNAALDPFNLFNLNANPLAAQQQGISTLQTQQQQYGQNQNFNQQPQQPQQSQLPVAPQVQQTQQPQQALPQTSASVDSRPVNFEKYVDPGKGTPLAPPPQAQCPRQPGWQPCITKDTANDRFRNCCSRLGEGCAPLCNYDATLATMQLAVLTGRCPLSKVGDVMICASGYQDASQCCEAYGVFEPGYEHCRPYCNPSAGLPEGGLLTEKYKCLVKLSHIQQCFFVSQKP
ncbi:Protein CBR-PQN-32 [Caenorhabditis briggsae]|uniref:Protein CBR-PQN-32 n=1 Tax=Caenorhabditis briggsae TaxID=6238 RepID=A8WTI6_CAEBR|nr:Protein CBR-PQN-32 [Caenorhabditis briggsae]CAP23798.2 Protein CBR-PQN-32 [Caenorhabditis briggsae]